MTGQLRDHRADRRYFDELIEANRQALSDGRRDAADAALRQDDPGLYVDLVQIYRTAAFTLANASYSVGDPVSRIAEYVPELISAETVYRRYEHLAGNTESPFRSNPADYVRPLQVLSLAILLDVDSGVGEFLEATGSQGLDSIYDFLADPDHDRSKVGSAVVWPKPYAALLDFVHNPDSPEPMQRFLQNWYNQNRRGLWWGTHLTIKDGDKRYSGYWCFEAAAVTKLLDADDSAYRDNEYYPRDLLREG